MNPTYVGGAVLAASIVLVLIVVRLATRKSRRSDRAANPPFLVFARVEDSATFLATLPDPLPLGEVDAMAALASAAAPAPSRPVSAAAVLAVPPAAPQAPAWEESPATVRPDVRPAAIREVAAGGAGPRLVGPSVRDSHRARSPEIPDDGTLQLLPGRVTILAEGGAGQEIRFVRVPGAPPEVTFGRSAGPAHRHVQIDSPTVSRLHARLRFENGGWILTNLSHTNPTRLNGQTLDGDRTEVPLHDGDKIELGGVTLMFSQLETHHRLHLRSSWASEIGLRSTNQDAVAVRTLSARRELAAVCDGVGSHKAGARASHTAIEALIRALSDGQDLNDAIQSANEDVRREAQLDASRKGMGTTVVALLRDGERYWIGNVGDSRAYRIDASGIRQITTDHSFLAEAVSAGEMSREEAERSPWRNAITRILGAEAHVDVDLFGSFSSLEPHILILCTDGLHGAVGEPDIERTVRQTPDIREVARALCDEAIRRNGKDNVTVAALAFGGGIAEHGSPAQ